MDHRQTRTEDRVDRLFHQSRTFTLGSKSLEAAWLALSSNGSVATAEKMAMGGGALMWLEEVAGALGVPWPLPQEQPGRDDLVHGKKAREVHDGLWAFMEELPDGCIRIEPEMHGDQWEKRHAGRFTLVVRLGAQADRLEKHLSLVLNAALAAASRAAGGGQVQAWRAKTRAEKRKRAAAKAAAGGGGQQPRHVPPRVGGDVAAVGALPPPGVAAGSNGVAGEAAVAAGSKGGKGGKGAKGDNGKGKDKGKKGDKGKQVAKGGKGDKGDKGGKGRGGKGSKGKGAK